MRKPSLPLLQSCSAAVYGRRKSHPGEANVLYGSCPRQRICSGGNSSRMGRAPEVLDEHMECIQALYPKEYNAVLRMLSECFFWGIAPPNSLPICASKTYFCGKFLPYGNIYLRQKSFKAPYNPQKGKKNRPGIVIQGGSCCERTV